MVVIAIAALAAAVTTASALGVRAFVLDKGFVGLPPVGATPSTPEDGELVLHWMVRSVTIGGSSPVPGSMPTGASSGVGTTAPLPEGANESTSGYLEQRLTPDGVELLRSQLVASGLFDRSRKLFVPVEYALHLGRGGGTRRRRARPPRVDGQAGDTA